MTRSTCALDARDMRKERSELNVAPNEKTKGQLCAPVTHAPTDNDPMDYWLAWVGEPLQKSVENIFETGDRLIAFREKFRHGKWLKAIHDYLHMSRQTVDRFIKIAENSALRNVTHVYHLPASWGTLYEITQLPDEIVRKKIASGEINASTHRKDVVRMRDDMKQMQVKRQKEDTIERLDKAVDAMLRDYQTRALDGQLAKLQHEEVVQATEEFIERLQSFIVNINEISPTSPEAP